VYPHGSQEYQVEPVSECRKLIQARQGIVQPGDIGVGIFGGALPHGAAGLYRDNIPAFAGQPVSIATTSRANVAGETQALGMCSAQRLGISPDAMASYWLESAQMRT
jgi:hypothetical protein